VLSISATARGRLTAVSALASDAATADGLHVGSSVDQLARLGRLHCELFREEEGVSMSCATRRAPNIRFLFVPSSGELDAARGGFRHCDELDKDPDRHIVMIVWRPNRAKDR
jgi:hypothetical protein